MSTQRTATVLTFLMLTVTVASSALATPAAPKRGSTNRCYTVRIEGVSDSSAETKKRRRRRYRHRFSARDVLDLRLSVWLPEKSDAGLVQIKLYTPTGRVYETLRASVDPELMGKKNFRGRRARIVTARLPIAGTHITSRSLYGKWRAEVYLDGELGSCTQPRPRRFTIER